MDGIRSTIPTGNQIEETSPHSPKPDFPEYRLLSERIKSFIDNKWPKYLKQTPLEMGMAGFFYTGKEDRTICGGGLMEWERGDDPFKHHAIWYNHCSYIQAIRPMSERESRQGLMNVQKNNKKEPKNERKRPSQENNMTNPTIDKKPKIKFDIMDIDM